MAEYDYKQHHVKIEPSLDPHHRLNVKINGVIKYHAETELEAKEAAQEIVDHLIAKRKVLTERASCPKASAKATARTE